MATVSHDLRTPLNGILGMLSVAIDQIFDENIKVFNFWALSKYSIVL